MNDLYDNKEWIHSGIDNNLSLTIYIITICGKQLEYCYNALCNLESSVKINVIMNIKPTSKAYDTMRERCTTKYFIQLDEDMELFPDAVNIIIKELKRFENSKTYMYEFKLIDDFLGVGKDMTIAGLKVYNTEIMKKYPMNHNVTSQVDKIWHSNIQKDGYIEHITTKIIGYHGKHRSPYDLLLRFSKSTKSFLDNNIKKNSGDMCRMIRALNFISKDSFDKMYNDIVSYFIKLGFNNDTFIINNKKLFISLSSNIPVSSLRLY